MSKNYLKSNSLLDLNVREVFEHETIEEIVSIHKKVNIEIEKKREELRMLVGERYRDLIDGADTIQTMRINSASIFNNLLELRSSLKVLPSRLTIQSPPRMDPSAFRLTNDELDIVAEVKLSIEIPQIALDHLKDGEIISAFHFIQFFKQKIILQNTYNCSFSKGLWENLEELSSMLYQNLKSFYEENLNSIRIDNYQKLCECIIAKHIATGMEVELIITDWLEKRMFHCRQEILNNTSEFILLIANTLDAIHQIFIEPELFSATAKEFRKFKIQPEIFGLSYPPKALEEYNNKCTSVGDPPRVSKLAKLVQESFLSPLTVLLESTDEYLATLTTMTALQEYRQTAMKLFAQKTKDIVRLVLGSSTNIWSHVFHPVFQNRAEIIAEKGINDAIKFLKLTAIPKFLMADANSNLITFIWKPTLLSSDTAAVDDDKLKIKCLTTPVLQLCEDLEFHFAEILVDYQSLGDTVIKDFISSHLVKTMTSFLEELINHQGKDERNGKTFSSIGRLTTGLSELCPTLWKLLEKNDVILMKQNLLKANEKSWEAWTNVLLTRFDADFQFKMETGSPERIINIIPAGVVYEATNSTETEAKFIPSVKIPVEINHALHLLLFSMCFNLAKVGPQCISKPVKDKLRMSLAKIITKFYEGLAVDEERIKLITPQVALQYIFDIKFIQWFHPNLSGIGDETIRKFRSIVDPFDWDIVSPQVTSNLKRFLFENQLTLGLMFSDESHGFISQNFKTKQSLTYPLAVKQLSYSQFPLLPI